MTDPTIATVDDEPWNQCTPERARVRNRAAQIRQIEEALTPGQRVFRGIPVLALNGERAQFVYAFGGHTSNSERCYGCDAACVLSVWTEYQYAPNDSTAKQYGREYTVLRDVTLCNTCSSELKALPLGDKWTKTWSRNGRKRQ
jgi:hypothetical protein